MPERIIIRLISSWTLEDGTNFTNIKPRRASNEEAPLASMDTLEVSSNLVKAVWQSLNGLSVSVWLLRGNVPQFFILMTHRRPFPYSPFFVSLATWWWRTSLMLWYIAALAQDSFRWHITSLKWESVSYLALNPGTSIALFVSVLLANVIERRIESLFILTWRLYLSR